MTATDNRQEGTLLLTREGPVATIVVSNVQRRNAMSRAMWEQLPAMLASLEQDGHTRVVVITGEGEKSFISGADISEFGSQRLSADAVMRYEATVTDALQAIRAFARPVIASINGYCIGGGMALALACDLRIAAQSARFSIPAARLGLGYEAANTRSLVQVVGPAAATEIMFTARIYDAQRALALGLVNEVHEDGALAAATDRLCNEIAPLAPLSIAASKRSIQSALSPENESCRQAADSAVARCATSTDYAEGVAAFMAKRAAKFVGQ